MRLPAFGTQSHTLDFHRELHREHLETAAFLYQQRQGLAHDSDVTWLDVGEFEDRLEAHIDALVWGDEPALETCRVASEEGDASQLYAALCVFCRRGRRDLVGGVLKRLDPEDPETVQAVSDALNDEMPSEWADALAAGVTRGFEKLVPTFARYLGYRRVLGNGALDALVNRVRSDGLAQVIWALGRLGGDTVRSQVNRFVENADAVIRGYAITAMLRQGDIGALATCRQRAAQGDTAMYVPLSISGGHADATFLRDRAVTAMATPDILIALGVLGEPASVGILIQWLTNPELTAAAATALHLITGAGLREEVFVPDTVQEDELFEEELETHRATGEGPQHADGRPFGVSVQRVSQNVEQWDLWLNKHRGDFDPGLRYRLGKPFSPATLVQTMVATASTRQVRALAYEELVVRYSIDVRFEVEMRVREQQDQINAIARLCRSREGSFLPGQWYFGGSLS